MATQAAMEDDEADEFFSQFDLDEVVASAQARASKQLQSGSGDLLLASGDSNENRVHLYGCESGADSLLLATPDQRGSNHSSCDSASTGRRPLSIRQKAEARPSLDNYRPFSDGPWERVMADYPQLKSLTDKFCIAHMVRQSRSTERRDLPVHRYPLLCLRIKFMEYSGSNAVLHDPSGEVEGWIDPKLMGMHPNSFKVGSVIVAKNCQVVASSWARPNVNIKEPGLYILAAPSPVGDGVTVDVLDTTVSIESFVIEAQAAWTQMENAAVGSVRTSESSVPERPTHRYSLPSVLPSRRNETPSRTGFVPSTSARRFPDPPASSIVRTSSSYKRPSLETAAQKPPSTSAAEPKKPRLEVELSELPVTNGEPDFPEDDFEDLVLDLPY